MTKGYCTLLDSNANPSQIKEAWKQTWTVITLADLGKGRTQVRVASMGFVGSDEESLAMRRFFEAGNAVVIKSAAGSFRIARGEVTIRPTLSGLCLLCERLVRSR